MEDFPKIYMDKNLPLDQWISEIIPCLEEHGGVFDLGEKDLLFWTSKLTEEIGEFANEVCEQELTKESTEPNQIDELGDIGFVWYIICLKKGLDPATVIKNKVKKTAFRKEKLIVEEI